MRPLKQGACLDTADQRCRFFREAGYFNSLVLDGQISQECGVGKNAAEFFPSLDHLQLFRLFERLQLLGFFRILIVTGPRGMRLFAGLADFNVKPRPLQ